ncbi:hypothetical protein VTN96DRAFT_7914 [Rasamsonia emersonii]|uniref:Short chain type dehydrogenase n=1 Tax=Rasamsonia emersonii (strain ATCC 16479 / CBS 393.64 / IMI 116815) TaxID=1408163 RepID=A0A0F4YQM2_RASE3|nr:Short chain type dehydrogenase [Rasamsonia emersonii CBS 393.64]KKA20554.1 Short chain type dehydrogenase [Rasamsonia emersonii CBS 393.64]
MASPATAAPRRTAIVTGSARGIGKAIALRLAQDGYSVCINDIAALADDINNVVNEINNSSSGTTRAIGVVADVTKASEVEAMIKQTVEQLGPLTLMVANAGIAQIKPLLDVTEADIDQVFDVNFKGVFNCYTLAAKQMIAQGDPQPAAGVGVYKIVGAASIVGFKAFATLGIYSASKWAVRGLTQALAMELAPHKITVNTYAPGIVGTNMWDQIDEALGKLHGRPKGESIKQYSQQLITLGRTSVPEDVAGLVGGFLASKDSDYVTGQTMLVDGGIIFN